MTLDQLLEEVQAYGVRNVAYLAGISDTVIYMWMNGKRTPSYSALCRVAEVLGYEIRFV